MAAHCDSVRPEWDDGDQMEDECGVLTCIAVVSVRPVAAGLDTGGMDGRDRWNGVVWLTGCAGMAV